ncbi:hypothetical protein NC651_036980 [Populus alba x Populus x berolinensis]|nr:hypothetical protein NC651_036980 [Populus alba x Populus x berolinensis]
MPQQFGLQELQTIQESLTYLSGNDSYHQGHSRALCCFLDLFIQQKNRKTTKGKDLFQDLRY